MEAVSTSEKVANLYQNTWCNILEDGHLHPEEVSIVKLTDGVIIISRKLSHI
jgi:hypothetical protein